MNLVQAYFEQRGIDAEITRDWVIVKSGNNEARKLGYINLAQTCRDLDAVEMRQVIIDHFDRQARIAGGEDDFMKQLEDWPFARERLRIRVWEDGGLPGGLKYLLRKDIPGLTTVLSVDCPESVTTAPVEAVAKWGIREEELFQIALANSIAELRIEHLLLDETRPDGPVAYSDDQSLCLTSLVLDRTRLQPMCGAHGAFVSLPTRHVVLAAPFHTLANLNDVGALLSLGTSLYKAGPGSLSTKIWWVKNGVWVMIDAGTRAGKGHATMPEELLAYLKVLGASEQART
jgi:hypothetical protein